MAKSLSRKSLAKAINKCKSRSAKILHKKAKTPAQRRRVLAKASKRCTKKKVLTRRRRPQAPKKIKQVPQPDPIPIPQPVPVEEEEELIEDDVIPPAEFVIRQIYPETFRSPNFDDLPKTPERFSSIKIIANKMMSTYSNCEECMITKFVLENEETGNQTVYTFEPTDPRTPDVGRFMVDIYVENIPEEFKSNINQMPTDIRNADCDKVEIFSEEKQEEILDNISSQRFSQTFLRNAYEEVVNAKETRMGECESPMSDKE